MNKYEIPTHLHVEDKLLGGLTVRQVLYVSVGISLGYALWQHLQVLTHIGLAGVVLRVAICALPVVASLICGFAQPTGRPLEEWILAALRYAALPKVAVWRATTHLDYGADGEDGTLGGNPSGPAGLATTNGDLPGTADAHHSASEGEHGEHDDSDPELLSRNFPAASNHSPSAAQLRYRFRLAGSGSADGPGGPMGASRLAAPSGKQGREDIANGADQRRAKEGQE